MYLSDGEYLLDYSPVAWLELGLPPYCNNDCPGPPLLFYIYTIKQK